MKKKPITVTHTTDYQFLILRTPPAITGANMGFDRDGARALIADQLAVYKFLWPDAPLPDPAYATLAPQLVRKTA